MLQLFGLSVGRKFPIRRHRTTNQHEHPCPLIRFLSADSTPRIPYLYTPDVGTALRDARGRVIVSIESNNSCCGKQDTRTTIHFYVCLQNLPFSCAADEVCRAVQQPTDSQRQKEKEKVLRPPTWSAVPSSSQFNSQVPKNKLTA